MESSVNALTLAELEPPGSIWPHCINLDLIRFSMQERDRIALRRPLGRMVSTGLVFRQLGGSGTIGVDQIEIGGSIAWRRLFRFKWNILDNQISSIRRPIYAHPPLGVGSVRQPDEICTI